MHKATYHIDTTQPAPSMSKDRVVVENVTYQQAVEIAADSWRETKRSTSVGSGEIGVYYYHMINYKGEYTDRNKNSGVPESGSYA